MDGVVPIWWLLANNLLLWFFFLFQVTRPSQTPLLPVTALSPRQNLTIISFATQIQLQALSLTTLWDLNNPKIKKKRKKKFLQKFKHSALLWSVHSFPFEDVLSHILSEFSVFNPFTKHGIAVFSALVPSPMVIESSVRGECEVARL